MTKKNLLALSVVFVLAVGLVSSLFLVRRQQQIGKKAATAGGEGKITLNPPSATIYPGQIFPVAVNFRTGSVAPIKRISGVTFRITYPYSGTTPELDVIDSTGNPANQIFPDSALILSGDWVFPIKSVTRTGTLVVIEFSAINTNISGYGSLTDAPLATIFLKANRVTTSPIALAFDITETKMTTKLEPIADILDNPVNGSYTVQNDTTPPSTITNLSVSNPAFQALTLSWTAPSDIGPAGKANSYDLRYSTSTINNSNWNSATVVSGLPAPATAGTNQTFTVTGLTSGATYYFGIKSTDGSGNVSALSNIPSAAALTATLSLGFKLQGIHSGAINRQFQITLKDANPVTFTASFVSNAAGVFFPQDPIPLTGYSIPVSGRTVDILIKDSSHLQKKLGSLTLTSGSNVAPPSWNSLSLLAGDFTAPINILTIDDISAMLTKYTVLSVRTNSSNQIYDVNSDGYYDVGDISLVLANYTALNIPGDN